VLPPLAVHRTLTHLSRWRAPNRNYRSKAPMTHYWIEDLGYSVENFSESGNPARGACAPAWPRRSARHTWRVP